MGNSRSDDRTSGVSSKEEPERPIEVPPDVLAPEVLQSLIESFVLREGTDYGAHEVSLERKIAQVAHQIRSGEVKIVFEAASESVTLVTRQEFAKSKAAFQDETSI